MPKFWLNEKFLVLSSVVLLLLFLGLIALFGSWMNILLSEPVDCPTRVVSDQDRTAWEQEIEMLQSALAELGPAEEIYLPAERCPLPEDGYQLEDGCFLTRPNIHIGLGLLHYRLGQHRTAEDHFLSALRMEESASLYHLLANNQEEACQYHSARRYLLKAIRLQPDNYDHWAYLIRLERERFGADHQRLAELYAAGAEAAGNERAFSSYARFLESAEEYQEAIRVWQAWMEIDPSQRERYRSHVEWLEDKIKR